MKKLSDQQIREQSLNALEKMICTTPLRKHIFEQTSAEVLEEELGNNGEKIKEYPEDDWRELR
jgi:hypothetical protein